MAGWLIAGMNGCIEGWLQGRIDEWKAGCAEVWKDSCELGLMEVDWIAERWTERKVATMVCSRSG